MLVISVTFIVRLSIFFFEHEDIEDVTPDKGWGGGQKCQLQY